MESFRTRLLQEPEVRSIPFSFAVALFHHTDFMACNKRLMQVKTTTGVFKIKFISDESFAQFAERVVLTASHYDIKIDSSVLHNPNDEGLRL